MATLYDQFGNPIDMSILREERAAATLTGVRSPLSGHPAQGLTPTRLAQLLRESESGDITRYLELAEEIEEKDLHYQGVLGTRKRQVSQLPITVKAASDDKEAQRHADFVSAWLERDCLEDELFDVLDALGKGFSVSEILWDLTGNEWVPQRIIGRDPRWFMFDPADMTTVRLRGESGEPQPLDPFKYVVHMTKAKSGIPIRGGLARGVGWAYLFKNFDIKGWVVFAETFGQPLRVGKYGGGATDADKATLLRALRGIGQEAAAMIPETMDIEFIKSEVRASSDLYERLANFMDRQVSKAVLGQTTTTDAISGGHAVGKEHNEVREDIERADSKTLSGTINRDVVRPMIDLNFGAQKNYPRIIIGRPEETDVKALVEAVSKLVPVGLRISEKGVRDKLQLAEPEDADYVLGATPAPEGDSEEKKAEAKAMAKSGEEFDPVDALFDEIKAGDELGTAVDALIKPIEGLADQTADYDQFTANLAKSIEAMEPDALAELIAKACFQGRLAGETGAD